MLGLQNGPLNLMYDVRKGGLIRLFKWQTWQLGISLTLGPSPSHFDQFLCRFLYFSHPTRITLVLFLHGIILFTAPLLYYFITFKKYIL